MNPSHGPHNQRHPPPSPQFITCSTEPGSSSSASSSHPQHQHEHQSAIFGRPAKMPRLLQQQSQPQQRFTSIGLPSGMSSQQKAANAIEEEMDHIVPDGTKDIQQISYMRFVRMFMSGKLKFPSDPREHRFGIEDLRDLGEIGAGRFGRVNKVLHTPTGREMAVKRVRVLTNRFDDSDDVRSMVQLQKEVRAIQDASTGTATDVVRYYGLTFHEGDCLICMELMDLSLERLYKTVHRVSKELGFDETVLGIVGVTVLNALSDLKEVKRIIHRDVKPSNILLNFRGQIKLCDFGISGYLEDSIARTKDVGCRPYMSPERLTATQDEYDIRTDVWSLGISLIETARGEYPYPDLNDKTFFAQIQQVVFGDPLFLGPMDNYSQKTIQFVNMCLIKEYRDRPTYEELMLTEFYRFFNSISDKLGPVSRYIQRILALEENLRN